MIDFDTAFDRLIGHEGGYVNHPDDPGGETQWGISKRSYPLLDIKNLSRDQAKGIYRADYWDKLGNLHGAIKFQVFDIAVNSGISTAIKLLQRSIGVKDDGIFGPISQQAAGIIPVSETLMLLSAERLDFWTSLPTWTTFGKGWARRGALNLRFAAKDM